MTRPIQMLAASVLISFAVAATVQAGIITKTNSTDGFFDSSNGTRAVNYTAGDLGGQTVVDDVTLSIFFAKSDNNSFVSETGTLGSGTPYYNEIEFVLTSPSGTNFTLISNDGGTELVGADSFETFNSGSGGFRGTITFDKAAAQPVDTDPDVLSAGTFRPDDDTANSLDLFQGESAVGTWDLFIEDDVGSDGLSFYEYSLTLNTTPEPSSFVLLCLAGLGIILCGRRGPAGRNT